MSGCPLQNGLQPINMSKPKRQNKLFHVHTIKINSIDSRNRKLGHIHCDRLHQLSMISHEIPRLTRKAY